MTTSSGSRRATLRDVANRASVSTMTVSNVVNDRTDQVGEEARQRVLQAISELNYRPHLRGRNLRLSRDFSIGLVILHPDRRFLNDPFNTEVAAGMSNYLGGEGYGLLIVGERTIESLRDRLPRLQQLDAVAVFGFGTRQERTDLYKLVAELGLPMMLIGDDLTDGLPDASFVRQENEAGAQALAETVLATGARRILFVRPDHTWPAITQRERGIRRAAEGIATVETIASSEVAFTDIVRDIGARLASGPRIDAVMGGNDAFGIAALHAAADLGIRVPDDLSVTGFNGFQFRYYSAPLLNSAESPAYEIGSEAGRRLLDRIISGRFAGEGCVLGVNLLPGRTVRTLQPL